MLVAAAAVAAFTGASAYRSYSSPSDPALDESIVLSGDPESDPWADYGLPEHVSERTSGDRVKRFATNEASPAKEAPVGTSTEAETELTWQWIAIGAGGDDD